jgi:hypothetical protein
MSLMVLTCWRVWCATWTVDVLMRWRVDDIVSTYWRWRVMCWCWRVGMLTCWCVEVLMTVSMCWCVDVLTCWCVDVSMCWCVDVLAILTCWSVDDCLDVLTVDVLTCWRADVLGVDVLTCWCVLMCWCVVCWCVDVLTWCVGVLLCSRVDVSVLITVLSCWRVGRLTCWRVDNYFGELMCDEWTCWLVDVLIDFFLLRYGLGSIAGFKTRDIVTLGGLAVLQVSLA